MTVPLPDPNTEDCRALSSILARVGDKWTVLIVVLLGDGPKRFNEIKRMVGGISQRMLTFTLRALERDGLVKRTVFPTTPPRVDYELTKLGGPCGRPWNHSVCGRVLMWARSSHRANSSTGRTQPNACMAKDCGDPSSTRHPPESPASCSGVVPVEPWLPTCPRRKRQAEVLKVADGCSYWIQKKHETARQ
jgi:DNA-binding HxlR family transcriptional regulator